MIIDVNTLEDNFTLKSDLCIVGSGAAGLTIATEFLESDWKVILLEGGAPEFDEESQSLYECVIEGMDFCGAYDGRYRMFGGSTTMWAGQCFEFADIDFEARDYIPDSGWPFDANELRTYYQRANRFFRLDELNYDTDLFELFKSQPLPFSRGSLNHQFTKWVPQPDIRKAHRGALKAAPNLAVYTRANVVDVEMNDSLERAEQVTVKSLQGKQGKVQSKIVVLCCGGIENARILLYCNRQLPDGLGNRNGLVGRYFGDHPGAKVGVIKPRNKAALLHFATQVKNGVKYHPRFVLDERVQRAERLPNAYGISQLVSAAFFDNLKDVWIAAKSRRITMDTVLKVIALAVRPEVYEIAYQYLVHGRVLQPSATGVDFIVQVEQEPNFDSRVALSRQADRLGKPRAIIDWKLSDRTGETLAVFANILKKEIEALGLGEVVLSDWLADWQAQWRDQVSDKYHHIGTTRMATTAAVGVVDPQCRIHDIKNMYVAGSSVFPTGGHSSPTLTIVALSMRLADHLKKNWDMTS
jgi:choline dehydrogenase-like flavoprotein